jgi:hypothetical protein
MNVPVIGAAVLHEGMSGAIAAGHLKLSKMFVKTFSDAQKALARVDGAVGM